MKRLLPGLLMLLCLTPLAAQEERTTTTVTLDRARQTYLRGVVALEQGHTEWARMCFRSIVDRHPESPRVPEALYQLGRSYPEESLDRAFWHGLLRFRYSGHPYVHLADNAWKPARLLAPEVGKQRGGIERFPSYQTEITLHRVPFAPKQLFDRPPKGDSKQRMTLLDPNEALAILQSSSSKKKAAPSKSGESKASDRSRAGSSRRAAASGRRDRRRTVADPTQPIRRIPGGGQRSGRQSRPSGNGSNHGLVLAKITNPKKRERAAKLIAEIRGIPYETALRLTHRPVVPVLSGVSREEAEGCLARFRESNINGKVTTR